MEEEGGGRRDERRGWEYLCISIFSFAAISINIISASVLQHSNF